MRDQLGDDDGNSLPCLKTCFEISWPLPRLLFLLGACKMPVSTNNTAALNRHLSRGAQIWEDHLPHNCVVQNVAEELKNVGGH